MSFNKIVIDRSIMFTHNDLYFSLKKKVYTGYQKKKFYPLTKKKKKNKKLKLGVGEDKNGKTK